MFSLVCAASFCSAETASPLSTSHNDYLPPSTHLGTSKESSSSIPGGLFPLKKQHWLTLKLRPKSGHGTSMLPLKSMPSEKQDSVGRLALHKDVYRTSITQRMLLCALFFSQQISAPELLPHKGLHHLHFAVVHCGVLNYCVRRRNVPK